MTSSISNIQPSEPSPDYFSKVELKPAKIEKITSQMKLMIDHLEDGAIREKLCHVASFLSSKSGKTMYHGDFANLLDGIFSASMEKLYDFYQLKDKKIIVTSKINYDGWGDYFQLWLAGKNLSQSFPEASISVVADVIGRTPPKISQSIQKIENLVYASLEDYEQKKIENEFEKADLVLNIPYGNYRFNDPSKKTPIIHIGEYGAPSEIGTGLEPRDSNVLGIFFKDASSALSLEELSHPSLRAYLTAKRNPFFVGYFSSAWTHDFILAALASHANRTNDIDIICPFNFLSHPSDGQPTIDAAELKKLNVAHISLMTLDENGQLTEKESLTLQSEGRTVRIFCPFPLANDDWMLLLKFCEPLVGCTGDMSFSEVISNQKIPFYELRSHKYQFFSQLLKLTEATYPNKFVKLCKYFNLNKSLESKYGNERLKLSVEMGALIDEAFHSEYRDFCSLLQKYHKANDRIASIVKKTLFLAENPLLNHLKEELMAKWINEEITLQEARDTLKSKFGKTGS